MVFHIVICSADAVLRASLQRLCLEYFSRRTDSCIVQQLSGAAELLERDEAGVRYELYLLELPANHAHEVLTAAAALRSRGCRMPLAFLARTPAHAYNAFRLDAMQYFLLPVRTEDFFSLLNRAVEPEYGPVLPVTTATGLRALPYCEIEYLECTHHVAHFHLVNGEEVVSLSLRVPFSKAAEPLLADGRFFQPHRSYIVNLAAARQLGTGELVMHSGARVPIPRGRESAARTAFREWMERSGNG